MAVCRNSIPALIGSFMFYSESVLFVSSLIDSTLASSFYLLYYLLPSFFPTI